MAAEPKNVYNNIRIYPENPNELGIPPNLILEIDGKKMKNVMSFSYNIGTGQVPTVDIRLVANVDMSADARVNKSVIDNLDGVQY